MWVGARFSCLPNRVPCAIAVSFLSPIGFCGAESGVPVEARFGDRAWVLVQIHCQCLSPVALRLRTRTFFHVSSRVDPRTGPTTFSAQITF
jgi:hypothetical protein